MTYLRSLRATSSRTAARADALSTVATLYIKQSVMRATHRMARPIHVPYNHLDLSNRVRRTSALLESRLGREPTMEEVAR